MWMAKAAQTRADTNTEVTHISQKRANAAYSEKTVENRSKQPANDMLEISEEGRRMQSSNQKITASSGDDTFRVTRGGKNNTYKIHFTDSAQVSRLVKRGYLTINGVRIDLSDETKEQLKAADAEARIAREAAFALRTVQENAEAARQQGEAMEDAFEDQAKAMEIARRIAKGGIVPPSDEQKLLEFSPELYMMAKNLASMAKEHEKYDSLYGEEEEGTQEASSGDSEGGTTSEVQMGVSLEGTPAVLEVSTAEVSIG